MRSGVRVVVVALGLAFGVMTQPVLAGPADPGGTTTVPCSAAALVAAITAANATPGGDTLDLAAGCTYVLTAVDNGHSGLPVVNSPILIRGNGATITRPASAPTFRILTVDSAGRLDLADVTISGGVADADCPPQTAAVCGGGIASSGTLTLDATTVTGNTSRGVFTGFACDEDPPCTAAGGGLSNAGTATVTDSRIVGNAIDAGGSVGTGLGAGISSDGPLTMIGSTVADNSIVAGNSGAGGAVAVSSSALTVADSTMSNNSIRAAGRFGGGGALYVFGAPFLHMTGSTVTDNSAVGTDESHGAIIIRRTPATISRTLVARNSSTATDPEGFSEAGGIDTLGTGGSLTLTDSQVLDNTVTGGFAQVGGVGGVGRIVRTVIRGNVVRASHSGLAAVGGGVGVYGQLALEDSVVQRNQSLNPDGAAASGGIHLFRGAGDLTATRTAINGNTASGLAARAGGIYLRPGTRLRLDASPVSGNTAEGSTAEGGGIANSGGTATLTASPVTNNTAKGATAAGGGLFNDGGSFLLERSPVRHNSPDNCFQVAC
jgi:hypothetical protein